MPRMTIVEIFIGICLLEHWLFENGVFVYLLTPAHARPIQNNETIGYKIIVKALGENRGNHPLSRMLNDISSSRKTTLIKNNISYTDTTEASERKKSNIQIMRNLLILGFPSTPQRNDYPRQHEQKVRGEEFFRIQLSRFLNPKRIHYEMEQIKEHFPVPLAKNVDQNGSSVDTLKGVIDTREEDSETPTNNTTLHKDGKSTLTLLAGADRTQQTIIDNSSQTGTPVNKIQDKIQIGTKFKHFDNEKQKTITEHRNVSSRSPNNTHFKHKKDASIGVHQELDEDSFRALEEIGHVLSHKRIKTNVKHIKKRRSSGKILNTKFKSSDPVQQGNSHKVIDSDMERTQDIARYYPEKTKRKNRKPRRTRAAVNEADDLAYLMQGESETNKEKMEEMIASDFSTPEELDKDIITDPVRPKKKRIINIKSALAKLDKMFDEEERKKNSRKNTEFAPGKKKHKGIHGLAFIEASWGPWGDWSDCTAQCHKAGFSVRRRSCDTLPDIPCEGNSIDVTDCHDSINCQATWQNWTDWGPCSVTCGEGVKARTRTCNTQDMLKRCKGKASEFHVCKMQPCRLIDDNNTTSIAGQPGPYYGIKRPQVPGVPALASALSIGAVTGGGKYQFTAWTRWGRCSNSCGKGNKRRARQCRDVTKTPPLRVVVKHCGGGLTLQNRPCVGNCGTKRASIAAGVGVGMSGGATAGLSSTYALRNAGGGDEPMASQEDYDVIQEEVNHAETTSKQQGGEEEVEEEEDDSYLTPETFIFIFLMLLSIVLFILAFCICIVQKSYAAKMKSQIRSLQPFYKSGDNDDVSPSGGSGSKIRFRQIYNFDESIDARDPDERNPASCRGDIMTAKDCEELMKYSNFLKDFYKEDEKLPRASSDEPRAADSLQFEALKGSREVQDIFASLIKEEKRVSQQQQQQQQPELFEEENVAKISTDQTIAIPQEVVPEDPQTPWVQEAEEDKPAGFLEESPELTPPHTPVPTSPVISPPSSPPGSISPPGSAYSPSPNIPPEPTIPAPPTEPEPEPEPPPPPPPPPPPRRASSIKEKLSRKISILKPSVLEKLGRSQPAPASKAKKPGASIANMTERQLAEELYQRLNLKGDVEGLLRSLKAQRIRGATTTRKNKREKIKALGRRDLNLRTLAHSVRQQVATNPQQPKPGGSGATPAPAQRRLSSRRYPPTMYPIHGVSQMSGSRMTFSSKRSRRFRRPIRRRVRNSRISGASSSTWLSSLLSETDRTLDGIEMEMDASFKNLLVDGSSSSRKLSSDEDCYWRWLGRDDSRGAGTKGVGRDVVMEESSRGSSVAVDMMDVQSVGRGSFDFERSSGENGERSVLVSVSGIRRRRHAGRSKSTSNSQSTGRWLRTLSEEDYDSKKNAVMGVMEDVAKQHGQPSYDVYGLTEILSKIKNSKSSFSSLEYFNEDECCSSTLRGAQMRSGNDIPTCDSTLEESDDEAEEADCENERIPSPFAVIWINELNKIYEENDKADKHSDSEENYEFGSIISSDSEGEQIEASTTSVQSPYSNKLSVINEESVSEDPFLSYTPEHERQEAQDIVFEKLIDDQINAFVKSSFVERPHSEPVSQRSDVQWADTRKFHSVLENPKTDFQSYTMPPILHSFEFDSTTSITTPTAILTTTTTNITTPTPILTTHTPIITTKTANAASAPTSRPHLSDSFLKSACDEIRKDLTQITALSQLAASPDNETDDVGDNKSSKFESVNSERTESFLTVGSAETHWSSFSTECIEHDLQNPQTGSSTAPFLAPHPAAPDHTDKPTLQPAWRDADTHADSHLKRCSLTSSFPGQRTLSVMKDKCLVRDFDVTTAPNIYQPVDRRQGHDLWFSPSDLLSSVSDESHGLLFEDSLSSIHSFETFESQTADRRHPTTSTGVVSFPVKFETSHSTNDDTSKNITTYLPIDKQTNWLPCPVYQTSSNSETVSISLSSSVETGELQNPLQCAERMEPALSTSNESSSRCEMDGSRTTQNSSWFACPKKNYTDRDFLTPPPPLIPTTTTKTAVGGENSPRNVATAATKSTKNTAVSVVAFMPVQDSSESEK